MFGGQLVLVPAIQSCSGVGREPLRRWAQGDSDDDDDGELGGCNDGFSSCGQLGLSTGREGEKEESGRGISQRRNGKMNPKKKDRKKTRGELESREETWRICSTGL